MSFELVTALSALVLSTLNSVILLLVLREVASARAVGTTKGLALNSALPEFTATTLDGTKLRGGDVSGHLLIFVAMDCGPCHRLLDEIGVISPLQRPPMVIAVTTKEDIAPNEHELRAQLSFLEARMVLVDRGRSLFKLLEVPGTPFVYAIDKSGYIRGKDSGGAPGTLQRMARFV